MTGATTKLEIYLVRSGFSDELLKGGEVCHCAASPVALRQAVAGNRDDATRIEATLLVAFSLLNVAEVGGGAFCYPAPRSRDDDLLTPDEEDMLPRSATEEST